MPDPVEKTEELVDEAKRGRSARTPWLVLGGMHVVVFGVVAVVLAIVFVVYLVA